MAFSFVKKKKYIYTVPNLSRSPLLHFGVEGGGGVGGGCWRASEVKKGWQPD